MFFSSVSGAIFSNKASIFIKIAHGNVIGFGFILSAILIVGLMLSAFEAAKVSASSFKKVIFFLRNKKDLVRLDPEIKLTNYLKENDKSILSIFFMIIIGCVAGPIISPMVITKDVHMIVHMLVGISLIFCSAIAIFISITFVRIIIEWFKEAKKLFGKQKEKEYYDC